MIIFIATIVRFW